MAAVSSARSGCTSFRPLAAVFACAVASPGESVKLSGALAQPVGGNVGSTVATPDGSRVVYIGDQEVDDRYELYIVPSDGSAAPVKLSDPAHGNVYVRQPRLTPDGSSVIYLTFEPALYRVPLDGSAAPLELAGDIAFQAQLHDFRYEISADGQWIVFREDDPERLLAVRTDGSLPPISLAPAAAVAVAADFRLSPDSSRVAFRAQAADTGFELYGVPIDGSAAPVRLNVPFTESTQNVSALQISPDGQSIVHVVHDAEFVPDGYGGGELVPEAFRLYVVAIDGSAAPVALTQLFPDPVGVHLAGLPAITPDSARVLYLADTIVDDRNELFSVPLDGSSGSVRLNEDFRPNELYGIRSPVLTDDGTRVVYQTSVRELFSAPVDRAGREVKLCPDAAFVELFELVPAGERVVYRARLPGRDVADLFSVAADGSLAGTGRPWVHARDRRRIVRLAQDVQTFELHPDGTTVLFQGRAPYGLFRVPVTGGEALELVSGRVSFQALPGERVLFFPYPDIYLSPAWQLFSIPLAGGTAVRLHPDLPLGPVVGRIRDFATSADGEWTVYVADGEIRQLYQLYSVPSDGSRPAAKISDDFGMVGGTDPESGAFRITPDGTRVVYLSYEGRGGILDLFVVPIDGSAPPIRLTEFTYWNGVQHGFEITSDGARAVFQARLPNGGSSVYLRLHSVRLDGSAPPFPLGGVAPPGGSLRSFEVSPDSTRVVYVSDEQVAGRFELFGVPIEGGSLVELQPVTLQFSQIGEFRFSADGEWVVYLFNPGGFSGIQELYSAPSDGSAPSQRFGPSGRVNSFELTPDGQGVVYDIRWAASFQMVSALFLAPLDASSSLRLTPPSADGPYSGSPTFRITPDGSRVAYVTDQEVDGLFELYSVPVDGSEEWVELSSAQTVPGSFIRGDFRVSPGGSRVVFFSDSNGGEYELFSVPIGGGEAPARLHDPIPEGGAFDLPLFADGPFALAGSRVAFALDGEVPGRTELYVALDGEGPPVKVNGPLQDATNDVLPFAFAGPDRLVYLAPERAAGIPELFSRSLSRIPPHRRR